MQLPLLASPEAQDEMASLLADFYGMLQRLAGFHQMVVFCLGGGQLSVAFGFLGGWLGFGEGGPSPIFLS